MTFTRFVSNGSQLFESRTVPGLRSNFDRSMTDYVRRWFDVREAGEDGAVGVFHHVVVDVYWLFLLRVPDVSVDFKEEFVAAVVDKECWVSGRVTLTPFLFGFENAVCKVFDSRDYRKSCFVKFVGHAGAGDWVLYVGEWVKKELFDVIAVHAGGHVLDEVFD